ncbi:molybdopterin-dependent oxidoreductase [Saccharopolyspora mangrovi]|uniref:Molybdopterin-dependent oxidoreductase n=1 Tax=Saccharopolyspora mangrovi TaxID=3082379 RepID=A0ABU6AJS6_9PSEU|nr:molybdopterin-dependent oxidoreductase [Saccharopolyspora sp. S2-29]MEB3371565.1 molybdopterin-dependent oxidoreductase [Saccharopolyspora sp. S2-29]
MTTDTRATGPADEAQWGKTACILCECNCGVEVKVEGRQLVKIRGDKEHPGSAGYTCEKPLRLDKYQNGPHRIDTPLRRRPDGTYEEIEWDTAIREIATKLAKVRDEHGGDKIFYYGGGGQGNHLGGAYGRALLHAVGAKYMSNALAQEKTGEAWVDQQLYGNHTTGDFEQTEVAIFIGKNPWQSHGVARARPVLREIARDPHRAMIVIDPRKSETAQMADLHLQLKPGTDAWCVSAIAATLVQEELTAREWLDRHTVGSDEVLAALSRIDIADHARRCGVPEDLIRAAARRIAAAKSAATYEDLGVQQSPNSTLVSYLNKMLWLLTGNFAKPGGVHIHSWVFPIAGRWYPVPPQDGTPRALRARRAVGTALMRWGARPLRRALAVAGRSEWSRAGADWGANAALRAFFEPVSVPAARRMADALGRSNVEGTTPVSGANIIGGMIPCNAIADEILTDHPDRLRAMWIDASNPAHSLAESARFTEAMRSLELSVVVDVAFTETARQADYVLPAASQFEKYEASLFTLHFPHNTFQVRRPLMDPVPGTRSEPEIYAAIIDKLGVVDTRLIDDLTAAAGVSRHAFALALFSAVENQPRLAGLVPYLLYRTLGATLPDGERSLVLIWALAHLCAIAQPDAVRRAGFTARGFAQGEQLFEAFRSRGEGVMFADDRYDDAWGYIQHADGKIHAAIPVLLDELARITGIEPSYTSEEFPFTLSAGERRSFTANVIIRNPEWRRRDKNGALRMCETDAHSLGIETGDTVRVVTATGSAETSVEISDMMQQGHLSLPNGMGVTYPRDGDVDDVTGVPLNTLTSGARRDKFFGAPWHKNVPARLEVLTTTTAPEKAQESQ